MRPLKNLLECYLGPFPVTEKVRSHSYLVNLPEHLQMIYPIFYISQLEPASTSKIPNCNNLPPPPIEVNGNLEFEVAQILNTK